MRKKKNECYSYFTVTGVFDPAEITAKLVVVPTKTTVVGELIPNTQKKREFSRWSLHSRLDHSAAIESHVSDVLDQLEANKTGFKALSVEYKGVIELVGFFPEFCPGVFFERELVERLASYTLSVDVDFYFPETNDVGVEGTTT